jgi:hypothetical protein
MKAAFILISLTIVFLFQFCTNRSCDLPAEIRSLLFNGYSRSSIDSSIIIKTDQMNNADTVYITADMISSQLGYDQRLTVTLQQYLTAGNNYLIITASGQQFEIKDFEFNTVECKESTFSRKEDILRLGAVKVNGNRVACEGKLTLYP